MKIKIEITDVPIKSNREYLIAFLQGELRIYIENHLFFNNSGILLIEFAISIDKWLKKVRKTGFADFVYETMDYDEPIINMIYMENGSFEIDSIWKEKGLFKPMSSEEVIAGFEDYLENLEKYLNEEFDIRLNDFYKFDL